MMIPEDDRSWAVVLAGGEGTRLNPLTSAVWGRPIPKQYCPMLDDGRSLLEVTLDRLRPVFPPGRTLVVINDRHREIAQPQLAMIPPDNIISHAVNLDTGPGLSATLFELLRRDPEATASVFPSDHFVRDGDTFRRQVERLMEVIESHPERIALLGIRPDRPDPGLGYIVPGFALDPLPPAAFRVRTFAEKPSAALAFRLIAAHDALWNSFIMTFRVSRILDLLRDLRPQDSAALEDAVGRGRSAAIPAGLLAPWSFSSGFLADAARHLAVVCADDFGWSDWGTPETIRRTAASYDLNLPWLAHRDAQVSLA